MLQRLKALFKRRAIEDDMQREMRLHMEMLAAEYEQSGMSAKDARLAARRRFGNLGHIQERSRDIQGAGILEDLVRDIRFAARMLRQSPVFTSVVVLSLALGIGANTALFSVVEARFLRKLAVEDPDSLIGLAYSQRFRSDQSGVGYYMINSFSSEAFERLRAQSEAAELFAFTAPFGSVAGIDGRPEPAMAGFVSGNYYRVLGIRPVIGRTIIEDDDRRSADPIVVISHRLWRVRFAGDPAVLGKTLSLGGVPVTIVGVLPANFQGTSWLGEAAFVIPMSFEREVRGRTAGPDSAWLQIMGRMKRDATFEQVRGNLEGVLQAKPIPVRDATPLEPPKLEVAAGSRGEPRYGGGFWALFLILGVIFGLLLLIVCVNIANMLLARAATRYREIGVRLAIGASRIRLIRQLLAESALLALCGGLIGVFVAYWSKDLLSVVAGRELDLRIEPSVLAFAAALSLLTSFVFGLAPSLQATRLDVTSAIKDGRETIGPRSRLSKTLMVAQIAMAVVLLVGAGLLLRTLGKLPSDDVGFNAEKLLVFRVNSAALKYDKARIALLYEQLMQRVSGLAGVVEATRSSAPLVSTYSWWQTIIFAEDGKGAHRFNGAVRQLAIPPGFFDVMDIPILRGRDFTPNDAAGSTRVAIITEGIVRTMFPGMDPIGRSVRLEGVGTEEAIQIVGIVKDIPVSTIGAADKEMAGTVFLSEAQQRAPTDASTDVSFLVRTAGDPLAIVPAIRESVRQIDPDLPLFGVTTQTQLIEDRLGGIWRIAMTWVLLAALGLILTCIGLYGLMSYNAARRTSEIGIRMALGASRLHVIRLVMGQTFFLVAIGLAIGAAASLAISQTIRALIFGVTLYDPATMVAVIVILITITGFSGYLPARRASRVDPTVALRHE